MKFLKTAGPYMTKIQLMLDSIDHEALYARYLCSRDPLSLKQPLGQAHARR